MTLISQQDLLRNLQRDSAIPLTWLILHPKHSVHQCLWSRESNQFGSIGHGSEVARATAKVPVASQLATMKTSWAVSLMEALLPLVSKVEDAVILPLCHESRIAGFAGWRREGRSIGELASNASLVRNIFRDAWHMGRLHAENQALKWLISRSDRQVACADANAAFISANYAAIDLLKQLEFGAHHYFRSDSPTLPQPLVSAMGAQVSGQVKLTESCSTRFDLITRRGCLSPVFGIEFFVQPTAKTLPPLSCLTATERQIYEKLLTGATYAQIAAERGTAFATVKNQVSTVLSKLGMTRRSQLFLRHPPLAQLPQQRNPGIKGVTVSSR